MKMLSFLLIALPLFGFETEPMVTPVAAPYWHGQTFSLSTSDALGSSTGAFTFSSDGASGSYETRGNIGGRTYTDKNRFDVVSSSSTELTVKYTWTSDPAMASYVVGKSETIRLNAAGNSISHGGKTYR